MKPIVLKPVQTCFFIPISRVPLSRDPQPPVEEKINGILLGFRIRFRELLYDRLRSYSLRTITSPSTTWTELTGGCPLQRPAPAGSRVSLVGSSVS